MLRAMAGRRAEQASARTPRGELTRIRESREKQDALVRGRIEAAMLEATGERGYRSVAVQHVIERYGGNRVQFYRHFAGKAECYAVAFETFAGGLCRRMLGAADAEPSWRRGLRAALAELGAFLEEDPPLAKGLLVEVHVAGEPALAKRTELLGRLVDSLETARPGGPAKGGPPALTGRLIVGAVESAACEALMRDQPRDFRRSLPELAHFAVAAYLGEEAAGEELAGAAPR
jgi:AcrR family transcriptional regulator